MPNFIKIDDSHFGVVSLIEFENFAIIEYPGKFFGIIGILQIFGNYKIIKNKIRRRNNNCNISS